MVPYSELKERLNFESLKNYSNGIATLTHYLHNYESDTSGYFREGAVSYYNEVTSELNLLKEPQLQFLLPLKWDVPFPAPQVPEFTFIDLFAGIGGFRIAMQALNGKCVFSCENNFHAQRSYEHNFGEVPFGDIRTIDVSRIPDHDILAAGFPCQPFSISGKMKGFNDTRGTLIHNVFEIIAEKSPKVVFLENVKHLVHHDKGRTLKTILDGLNDLGYQTSWKLLNASGFGVPQNRERIIIIGHKTAKFDFGNVQQKPKPTLKNFLQKDAKFEYLEEPYTILDDYKVQDSGLIFIGYRNKKIRNAGVRPGTTHLSRVHKQPNRIYSSEGLHPALPSQESSGRFWILDEGRVRKLTIKECYAIMGFPQNFLLINNLSELYRQVGNSVCVPMVNEIAKQIKTQLL